MVGGKVFDRVTVDISVVLAGSKVVRVFLVHKEE